MSSDGREQDGREQMEAIQAAVRAEVHEHAAKDELALAQIYAKLEELERKLNLLKPWR